MFDIDLVVSEFDEILDGVQVGMLGIVECEDGLWFCRLDERVAVADLSFHKATSRVKELYARARMTSDELIDEAIEMDKRASADAMLSSGLHHDEQEAKQMLEYTGSREKYVRDFFEHSFEPAFGSDFRL